MIPSRMRRRSTLYRCAFPEEVQEARIGMGWAFTPLARAAVQIFFRNRLKGGELKNEHG